MFFSFMNASGAKKSAEEGLSGPDKNLKRVVELIVTEFHGDTVAFYESIRGKSEDSAVDSNDLVIGAFCTKSHERVGSRGSKTK
jgi:hypothetical protein